MNLSILMGIGIIAIGAFASGSFSMPFEKTKGWKWENYWLVYSFFAYVVVPIVASLIFCPNFVSTWTHCSPSVMLVTFALGVIYGICNLTFGLSLRYLGVSLGFMLSLGLIMVFGTITPPLLDGRLSAMMQQKGGALLIIGLLVAAIGVAVSAYAGYHKDKLLAGSDNSEFNFKKGLFMALFVGVTGTSQALGIEHGASISKVFEAAGTKSLFSILPAVTVLFMGSFVITLIWCLVMSKRNGTLQNFAHCKEIALPFNYLFSALAGFLWFIQMIFYGMGKSMMGTYSFTAWGILMSLTIVCATIWGIYRGEWKAVTPAIRRWMYVGLLILIVASFIIGMSSGE